MMWLFSKDFRQGFSSTLLAIALAISISGCVTRNLDAEKHIRPFNFAQDTFAFPNDLVWEYFFDANGEWTNRRRDPQPDYTHHCFVVAHAAKQFFQHARFAPDLPRVDDESYRKLIREIVSQSDFPRERSDVVIPGFANLREFSESKEALLKKECGGAWRSYFQRGHWRIMIPFTRNQQETTRQKLIETLGRNHVAVLHLVRFPQLTINHAVVLFDFHETARGTEFSVYDPNKPEKPGKLTFDYASRTFLFPANDYFIGGKVNVYEVYRSCFY